MRFTPTIFSKLLEPLDRRKFAAIVARHGADAYDKRFRSWDHLVALVFAQLGGASSLRALEAGWNASAQHHYHLGAAAVSRSTLADAGARRPPAVFAEAFALLAGQIDRRARRDAGAARRLVDSTPIPLGKLCGWAKSNGRTRGMKMHIAYDPGADLPRVLDVTHANVNDIAPGRAMALEAGATYVFDKGYCHYGWWAAIDAAGAFFVTRPKANMRLCAVSARGPAQDGPAQDGAAQDGAARDGAARDAAARDGAVRDRTVQDGGDWRGEGFGVLADEEVRLASKGDSVLAVPLRRVRVACDDGRRFDILTNDLARTAAEVGALYKARWQVELLFRWLKQHLRIRRFLGNCENAVRLQLYAAMIAFALLRIAAAANKAKLPALRFAGLVASFLFERRSLAAIEKPPPTNPSRRKDKSSPDQAEFAYA